MKDNNKTVSQSLRQLREEKRRRKIRRLITFAILELFALALIFGYTYFLKYYSKIQRLEYAEANVKNNDISVEHIKKMEGYWTFAVFGVDSRNSSVGKGNNSDVIMVISMNRATGDIKIVSVYRDTYLDTGNGKLAKINSAYAAGGPEQAVKALNKNLDLDIRDYITFNWKAVATTVNLMGGVDIDVTPAELKEINGYITETVKGTSIGSTQLKKSGMQHLDGIQAVAYARLRHMDSDFERTARQRRILEQIFKKAKTADPRLLIGVMEEVLPMVATNLSLQDGLDMISSISKFNIKETKGFPEKRADSDMGSRGWNVIPKTLVSNVTDLHTFLFGNEEYGVSSTVKSIDAKIAASGGGPLVSAKSSKNSTSKETKLDEAIEESKNSDSIYESNKTEEKTKSLESTKSGESTKNKESIEEESTKKGESVKATENTKENSTKEQSKESSTTKANIETITKETTKETTTKIGPGTATKEVTKSSIDGPTSKETVRNVEPTIKETTIKETTRASIEEAPGGNAGSNNGIDGAITVPDKPQN